MRKPSNTKATSTRRLPKLERLLLDTDVNVELEPLLEAVGFRTEFALRVEVDIRKDTAILRWARRHRRILVCHDKHKDRETQLELFPEIYRNGGKVIRIGGGPGQDIYTSPGKILLHRQKWLKWFQTNDGIVTVHESMNKKDAHQLYQIVQGDMDLVERPVQTLRHRKPVRRQTKPSGKKIPPEQPPLSSQ